MIGVSLQINSHSRKMMFMYLLAVLPSSITVISRGKKFETNI